MQSYQRFQHIVHTVFNTSGTNALRSLSRAKVGYTLGFAQRIVHKGTHGETRGVSDGGWYHYPRSVSHGSETLRGRGLKRQTLPLLGLGRRRSRRTQRAFGTAMRLCASLFRRRRGPAGLRDLFRFCRNCGLYALFQILLSVLQTLQLVLFLCKLRLGSFFVGSELFKVFGFVIVIDLLFENGEKKDR